MRNITFSLAYYDREPHCTIDTLAPRACAVQGSQSSMRRPASTPAHSHLFTFCLSRDLVSVNCAVWFPVIVSGWESNVSHIYFFFTCIYFFQSYIFFFYVYIKKNDMYIFFFMCIYIFFSCLYIFFLHI